MKLLKFFLLTFLWVYFCFFACWGLLWLHLTQSDLAKGIGMSALFFFLMVYIWQVVLNPFQNGISEVTGEKN